MSRAGWKTLTFAVVIGAWASQATGETLLVQACPEESWTCETYDWGEDGVETYCDCYTLGDIYRTPKWETVPLEQGPLPSLSIADAQTIAVSGLTVLAGVWGIGKIGRLIRKL